MGFLDFLKKRKSEPQVSVNVQACSAIISRQVWGLFKYAEDELTGNKQDLYSLGPEFICLMFGIHGSGYTDLFRKYGITSINELLEYYLYRSQIDYDTPLAESIRQQIKYYMELIIDYNNNNDGESPKYKIAVTECKNRMIFLLRNHQYAQFGVEAPILPIDLNMITSGAVDFSIHMIFSKLVDAAIERVS